MRRIVTTTFATLDGVMQAPGGPEEDTAGGFAEGGWSFGYWDGVMGAFMNAVMGQPFELLLGRRTYDIFAAHWPKTQNDPEVAAPFNRTRKYVVSRRERTLEWENSTLVTGDVVPQLAALKEQDGPDLWVHGSGELVQTLLAHDLVDRMIVWTFPVTIGGGKRLFGGGTQPRGWRLADSTVAGTGVIIATYEPAGAIRKGSFAE
jgi:dihydrofolate reductase